jgi:hypothetical protein
LWRSLRIVDVSTSVKAKLRTLTGRAIPMLRTLFQAFTNPVAGPVGFALSLALCAMLVVTAVSASQNEAMLRSRISALTVENQRNGLALHARLAACEGGPAELERNRLTTASTSTSANVDARAERLSGEPVGFDVCARMESADRAVLETLSR